MSEPGYLNENFKPNVHGKKRRWVMMMGVGDLLLLSMFSTEAGLGTPAKVHPYHLVLKSNITPAPKFLGVDKLFRDYLWGKHSLYHERRPIE